jgi:hypothetical protein
VTDGVNTEGPMPINPGSLENYLEIDHRESPGFTEEQARRGRFGVTMPVGSKKFQLKTYTCCGCQRQIIMRDNRVRPRHRCSCDKFICDGCALTFSVTGVHKPFTQVIEDYLARSAKLI